MERHATDESVGGTGPVDACSGGSLVVTEPSTDVRGRPSGLRQARPTEPAVSAKFIPAEHRQGGDR